MGIRGYRDRIPFVSPRTSWIVSQVRLRVGVLHAGFVLGSDRPSRYIDALHSSRATARERLWVVALCRHFRTMYDVEFGRMLDRRQDGKFLSMERFEQTED